MRLKLIVMATSFEIRSKTIKGPLLKINELKKAAKLLNLVAKWCDTSDYSPDVEVVTCYDEIHELCVQRRIKSGLNYFSEITAAGALKKVLLSIPTDCAIVIASINDEKRISIELLENICKKLEKFEEKIVVTRIGSKITLPAAFPSKQSEKILDIINNDGNKIKIAHIPEDVIFLDMREETIGNSLVLSDMNDDYNSKDSATERVVIIAGGGKLGSSVAKVLTMNGFKVLITETSQPETLFLNKAFASAVYDGEVTVANIKAVLVSPVYSQFENAWKSGLIPVVVDKELKCASLFNNNDGVDSLYKELDARGTTLSIFDEPRSAKIPLAAIIDLTSDVKTRIFEGIVDVLTIGMTWKDYGDHAPDFLINLKIGTGFGDVVKYNKVRNIYSDDTKFFDDAKALAGGVFSPVRAIGDYIKKSESIGQIKKRDGTRLGIHAESEGMVAGIVREGVIVNQGDVVAYIDKYTSGAVADYNSVFSRIELIPGHGIAEFLQNKGNKN